MSRHDRRSDDHRRSNTLIDAMLISVQILAEMLNDLRWRDALELTGYVGAIAGRRTQRSSSR